MSKTQEPAKNKGGRPPTDTEGLTLRISRETLSAIDNVRRSEEDVPTRPEAIRRILNEWLRDNGYLTK